MGQENGGDYYPWNRIVDCAATSHHSRALSQRRPQKGTAFLVISGIVITLIIVANFRYEGLLGENFERVYFEKPTKFHKVGATDMMSVYRRRA